MNVEPNFRSALLCTVFFLALEEVVLSFPLMRSFVSLAQAPVISRIFWVMVLTIDFLLFFLFLRFSVTAGRRWKIFYFIFFAIAIFGQYSYQENFGRYLSTIDFALIRSSDSTLWRSAAELFLSRKAFFVAVLFGGLLVSYRSSVRANDVSRFSLLTIFLFFSSLVPREVGMNAENLHSSLVGPAGVHFYQTFFRYLLLSSGPHRKLLDRPLEGVPSGKNIVLIIDESIRADHLSLSGYSRDTTPFLRELESMGFLTNYGTAISGATCSPLSNAMLITATPPSEKSVTEVFDRPTIFHFAKRFGYRTVYIDAQSDVLWNGLTGADLPYVEEWIRSSQLGEPVWRDLRAAERIRNLLSQSSNTLVVFNKRGAHFMYEDSYPQDRSVWTPLPPNRDYRKYPELVSNPYDNSIRFSVNEFFETLLPDPERDLQNTVIIYTSDHGQTLFEEGASWLHCNHLSIESQVPLFFLAKKGVFPVRKGNFSHQNILPTVLDLMGIRSLEKLNLAPSVFSATQDSAGRCFVSGALQVVCPKQ